MFIDFLYTIDIRVLHLINVDWAIPGLDAFWSSISHLDRECWFKPIFMPVLLIGLFYIYRLQAFKPLTAFLITVTLSDALAYRVIKAIVHRPRPFENPEVSAWLRHVGDAHGWSFPSSHAANCFAAAGVLTWYFASGRNLFYIFALLVALSRIFLGVHYPSDVVGGAVLGILVGFFVKVGVLQRFRWFRLGKSVSSLDSESSGWRKRSRRLEDD